MKMFMLKMSALLSMLLPIQTIWAHSSALLQQNSIVEYSLATALYAGFLHTLSGIDHLLLALGLGILLFKLNGWLKPMGAAAIASALLLGFVLGSAQWVSSQVAELGIIFSLALMLIAFWKHQTAWLVLLMVGVSCHGLAHGIAVASLPVLNQLFFMSGMMLSFTTIIALGFIGAQYAFMLHRKNAKTD